MSAARFPRVGVALLAASISIGVAPTGAPARPPSKDSQTVNTYSKDRVRPSVAWKPPAELTSVSGLVDRSQCLVEASDNTAVAKVEFKLDGSRLEVVTAAPFTCAVDTTKLVDGR